MGISSVELSSTDMITKQSIESLKLKRYNEIAVRMFTAIFLEVRKNKMGKSKKVNDISMGGFPQRDTKFVQRFFADYNPIYDIQGISACLARLEHYIQNEPKSDEDCGRILSYLNELSYQLAQIKNSCK